VKTIKSEWEEFAKRAVSGEDLEAERTIFYAGVIAALALVSEFPERFPDFSDELRVWFVATRLKAKEKR
jgi:hypothetical protein